MAILLCPRRQPLGQTYDFRAKYRGRLVAERIGILPVDPLSWLLAVRSGGSAAQKVRESPVAQFRNLQDADPSAPLQHVSPVYLLGIPYQSRLQQPAPSSFKTTGPSSGS